jgi:F-type H+-transporting ATPase subunit gamma
MQTLESLRRQIGGVEDLRSIVRTMKALAAVSIRQYETAVAALTDYHRTIELGLRVALADHEQDALPSRAGSPGRAGAVVFGSDHGMCGQFNEQVVEHALRAMARRGRGREGGPGWLALGVGARAVARLTEADQPAQDGGGVPATAAAIPAAVQRVLLTLDAWRARQRIDQVWLFYHRPLSNAASRPHGERLMPIDARRLRRHQAPAWPSRSLPAFSMEPGPLVSALVQQHVFASLCRAFAESLASENASRLASMQAAERNIDEHLEALNTRYHEQRQNAITGELLDIVSGFEALSGA